MFKIFSAPWPLTRRASFAPTQPAAAGFFASATHDLAERPQARQASELLERAWADTCLDDQGAPGAH